MKKYSLILAIAITLALIATSCNPPIVPPIGPQNPGPGPGEPNPQGPQPGPGEPNPQGPQPGEPLDVGPGEIQITFTADRTTLSSGQCAQLQWAIQGGFAGFINGQPVEPSGQQQVCPTANTTYRLEVDAGNQMHVREINIAVSGGGGGNSSSSGNPGVIQIITGVPMESAKYDIGLINLFARSGDGKIMVTIKNTGNQTWTKSYTLSCIGDWRTCDVCNYASSSKTENITLAVGDIHNTSTGFSLNANLTSQKVTCTLATSDSNSSNNSIGPTSVK